MPKSKLGSDVPLLNPQKSKKTPLTVFFAKLMIKQLTVVSSPEKGRKIFLRLPSYSKMIPPAMNSDLSFKMLTTIHFDRSSKKVN